MDIQRMSLQVHFVLETHLAEIAPELIPFLDML
jgi:hypothetical protein